MVLALLVVGVVVFLITGLRYDPGSVEQYSPAVCITGSPCRTHDPSQPIPGPGPERWDWAPFWVTTN